MPVLLWLIDDQRTAVLFGALTVLLWIMHRPNIVRLLAGTEPQIGRSAPAGEL
jgi:glycerol-3-phosphate acyltransferase PlsY